MASQTGGQYIFTSGTGQAANLILTTDGGDVSPVDLTADFDIEVFTTTVGTPIVGVEGTAFAPGGTLINDLLAAPSLTMLSGDYWVSDQGQNDSIAAGLGDQTINGGTATTIFGAADGTLLVNTGNRNVVFLGSADSATVNALTTDSVSGVGELINLGENNATVFASGDDTVNAAAGAGTILFFDSPGDTLVSALTIQGAAAAPTYTITAANGESLVGGAASVTAIAAAGDTVQIGDANATVNALSGFQTIVLGGQDATVFSGGGDSVFAGAGQVDIVFADDPVAPASDTITSALFLQGVAAAPNLTIIGAGGGTLFAAADTIDVRGQAGDTIQIGSASAATVDALAGNIFANLGAGNSTVYAASGDTLIAGAASDTVAFGSMPLTISGGSVGGQFTVSSAAEGSLVGFASNLNVQAYGNTTISAGGVAASTINAIVDGTSGQLIQLGQGQATVFAASNDTIVAGSGVGAVVVPAGGEMTVAGAGGDINITMASAAIGGGNVFASAEAANIIGDVGDSISVAGGNQTINAIAGNQLVSFGGTDSVSGDSVWGGTGDTIGVGVGGGNGLLLDSTVDGAGAVGFGTFLADTTGTASTAEVTVGTVSGGAASEGFDSVSGDYFFYPGSTDVQDAVIIAAATDTTVGTVPSVLFTLPDGTSMTVVGLTQSDLDDTMFRPA